MEREIHMGNKTRRLAAVLLAVLLLLGLNACGTASDLSSEETSGGIKGAGIKEPETEAPNGEDSGAEHPGKENFGKGNFGTTDPEPTDEGQPLTTEGQAALERLWSLMEDQPKAPLAAACLGEPTWRDPDSLKEYFREHFSYMVEELPFLLEIPEDRILGEGELLYCVVPRDGNTSLAVNRVSWKSSGSGNWSRPESQVEEVLYRSENAQPLLVFVDYDFMDENDRRWPDIQISAVAGNGGAVVWYPDCYPETFIINAPIDEDYDPLILELENLTGSGPDNQANGGDGWTAPTEIELDNTYWYGSGDWYMMLWADKYSDLYYDKRVDIFQTGGAQYSGVWEMDGECLYLQVVDSVGNVTEGRYPVTISPSGKDLYICEDPKSGVRPVFFGEEDKAVMYLTLVDN